MAKFILRRLLLMLLTMLLVSIAVFLITEAAPGNVARNVLGIHITPEQEASFLKQQGLDKPLYVRYLNWLIGSDWRAERRIGMPVKQITTEDGFREWWAVDADGSLIRWDMEGEDLIANRRQPDGSVTKTVDNDRWRVEDPSREMELLTQYRAEIAQNDQLDDADREAILRETDQIIAILDREHPSEEALEAALSEPEAALEAMIDPDALRKQTTLQQLADRVGGKNRVLQALVIHQQLSDIPAGQLGPSDIESMARQLRGAAQDLQEANPRLADQLEQTAQSLEDGDTGAALATLEDIAPRLDELTGSLGTFMYALEAEDYRQALVALRRLSDPSQETLDAAEQTLIADLLAAMANQLEDDLPKLGDSLTQAADGLQSEDAETARQSLAAAANQLEETASTIVRSQTAQGARVARTFWGVDTGNRAVKWQKGTGEVVWRLVPGSGWLASVGGPVEYVPLQKGLVRGDPGLSLRTGRPVADLLFRRLRNSLVLAGIAFVIVMPLALLLGLIAGLNQGKTIDRVLSVGGMMFSVTPQFVTGIFLILIFAFWLDLVPGATVFGEKAPWERPRMLILPVATLTLVELGYVLRITRASMVEVMREPYIRTAFLKGLPYRRIVFKHAVRNALMAPITVIMLHVNWLLGGIVVVEVIFGYPGLGSYILDSTLFKDFNAIEGGAMVLVAVAVTTQLLTDILYTFLNPRIRFT
ncbi:MAG: ABC transporter permease subunit [Chloroflexota bacterium]|nr:ABC transporter permease subunit [Chloroflexota bacterium]